MITFDMLCWFMGLVVMVCGVLYISAGLIYLTAEALSWALIRAVKQPQNIKAWKEFKAYKHGKLIDNNASK